MFPPRLLMVHNARRGSQHNVPKLTRWQQLNDPLLHVAQLNVVAWRDDAGLVEAAGKLNNDFAAAVVVDFLEFADVA